MLNFLAAIGSAPGGGGGSFESIATATASASTTITFSSIPSTYQHLQVRINLTNGTTSDWIYLRFNSDTGSNYANHSLQGNGSTVSASSDTQTSQTRMRIGNSTYLSTAPSVFIVDIHDYASSTKNKTVRSFNGRDENGAGIVKLVSGLWMNTNAVNSINFTTTGTDTFTGTFALYGIKG